MRRIKKVIFDVANAFNGIVNSTRASLLLIVLSAIVLNIAEESALRKSLKAGIKLMYKAPLNFFYGTLIIFAAYSVMYLVKHRLVVYELVTILFATIAAVSRTLMSYRTTPFNASDFRIIQSALTIIPVYLEPWEIVVISLLVIAAVALLVFTFIKGKKAELPLKLSAVITAVSLMVTAACTMMYLQFRLDSDHFSNLPNAYRSYGFNICFFCSIFDHGISKPKDYSAQKVENIIDMIAENVDETPVTEDKDNPNAAKDDTPNIIFIQLESFYDVNKIEGYTYSENPVPTFTKLKENYPHGLFRVPSIGAGTANTEFEVLTGMEVSYFGIAEYPYLSVLQNNTCESLAYITKNHGYTAHAIHNHRGTFYDRNKVFPNLGFDTFTSLENMTDIQKNPRNWAKDSMLTSEILLALESTPYSRDFIYTVTVQPHGRYPGSWESYEKLLGGEQPHITVSGNDDNPENPGFSYYVNQLHESDTFISSVISEIIANGEPTILVLYGDHLPAFTVQNWTITDGDYYTTDYVIWNNCGIDFSDAGELTSYQIGAYVMSKLGFTDGSMNKLNQKYLGTDEDYSEQREILEYDLLYGNKTATDGENEYQPTEIKFGLAKIKITSMSSVAGVTYVKGENFNEYSTVTVNGKIYDTSFIDKNSLVLNFEPSPGDSIAVVQLAGNHTILGGTTEDFIFEQGMIIAPQNGNNGGNPELTDNQADGKNGQSDGTDINSEGTEVLGENGNENNAENNIGETAAAENTDKAA